MPALRRFLGMILSASIVAMAMLVAAPGSVLAVTTRWVNVADLTPSPPGTSCADAGYTMIQDAVDDADPGDTIEVCPGTYAEQVMVNQTVDIFGSAGAIVAGSFTVIAPFVTVDGFTVNNPTGNVGINVKVTGSGSVISNNTLAQVGSETEDEPVAAIYLERGPDNVDVLNNDISAVLSDRAAQGIHVGDSVSTDESLNILIQGNTISRITSTLGGLSGGAYGIQVNNGANPNPMFDGFAEVEIRNNTIDTVTGSWARAIGLEGPTPTAVVEDNSMTNVTGLVFDGTAVFFEANPFFDNAEVHFNNFNLTAVQFGIALHPTLLATAGTRVVDGECNWWNSSTGPTHTSNPGGTGARTTNNVDYEPWLDAPAPGGQCIGGLESTPGKVTGGGQIDDSDPLFSPLGDLISLPAIILSTHGGAQANFGFVIQLAEGDEEPRGNLTYHDQGADVRIKATSFDLLAIEDGICGTDTHATFHGMADVNGNSESLTVVVDDCGEGSSGPPDTFSISTDTYDNGGPLVGGNIQIHE